MPILYWLVINLFLAYEVHGNYRRRTVREDARVWAWGVATLIFGVFAAVMYLLASDEYRA